MQLTDGSATEIALSISVPAKRARVRVFVDYWNFQLTLNKKEAAERSLSDYRFQINWGTLGSWLARKACEVAHVTQYSFDGVIIYTSHDPHTNAGARYRRWCMTWLDMQPGVKVECRERKAKASPTCPACRKQITHCPHCQRKIAATEEKGVDILLATDMIRLAWEEAYDLAVLATVDRDLIPAVELLGLKGRRIVHAGFAPLGAELARACWASFDVYRDRFEIQRRTPPVGLDAPLTDD
jgi:uncharacterized LabA/DUF88 family protein